MNGLTDAAEHLQLMVTKTLEDLTRSTTALLNANCCEDETERLAEAIGAIETLRLRLDTFIQYMSSECMSEVRT